MSFPRVIICYQRKRLCFNKIFNKYSDKKKLTMLNGQFFSHFFFSFIGTFALYVSKGKKLIVKIDNYLLYHRYRTAFLQLLTMKMRTSVESNIEERSRRRGTASEQERGDRKREREKKIRLFFRIIKCTSNSMCMFVNLFLPFFQYSIDLPHLFISRSFEK